MTRCETRMTHGDHTMKRGGWIFPASALARCVPSSTTRIPCCGNDVGKENKAAPLAGDRPFCSTLRNNLIPLLWWVFRRGGVYTCHVSASFFASARLTVRSSLYKSKDCGAQARLAPWRAALISLLRVGIGPTTMRRSNIRFILLVTSARLIRGCVIRRPNSDFYIPF